MTLAERAQRIHPVWWAIAMFGAIIGLMGLCMALFAGTFNRYLAVTLVSERTGLVMESGAKVKLRGVEVGRVAGVDGGGQPTSLQLEIFPRQADRIPANVEAEIKSTTAFGAKYVELIYPEDPSPQRLTAGEVLRSRNVTTEVNTVFDNLVGLLDQIDVAKLNSVLSAVADSVRGQGERIGRATTDAYQVLQAVNPRMDTVAADWRSFGAFSDAYASAAANILSSIDAASTTADTITAHAAHLDALLLSTAGFANRGTELLAPHKDSIVDGINVLEPTTSLLLKYNPEYTCTIQGAKVFLDKAGNEWFGGDGRTVFLDAGISFGDDLYRYPENLPIVAAKGGPGGKPGCGSLPDAAKNFPVRQLVTNTGFGTGLDWRPNPGIGRTCAADYFPVTRAVPEPPHVGECLPGPAPGPPPPYPGGPPYGAPWYAADGTPLYPGLPVDPAPVPPPAP
ncbi:MCE family protein [Mycolicibacterium pulveris]|uniref:Virulence factor n=1 Tax=Mycolicibacterium pulveris TaxID=36813 RepID=A0A7I7UFT3_MYCPV|nr:MCE family protein [Mycolicibacterium pulveris]MCV6979043.1 MCE family protein [Mycolicibacterium pulveris]BBY79753.1 virulence factor [Mycolicibacterium pulveris]